MSQSLLLSANQKLCTWEERKIWGKTPSFLLCIRMCNPDIYKSVNLERDRKIFKGSQIHKDVSVSHELGVVAERQEDGPVEP